MPPPRLAWGQDEDTGAPVDEEPSGEGRGVVGLPWRTAPPVEAPALYVLTSTTGDPLLESPNASAEDGPFAVAAVDHAVTCYGTTPSCATRTLPALSFALPDDSVVVFRRLREGVNMDGSLTWVGAAVGGHTGHVIVTFAWSSVSADLKVDGVQAVVRPTGWGGHFVQTVEVSSTWDADVEDPAAAEPDGDERDTADDVDTTGWTQPDPPPANDPWGPGIPFSGPAQQVTVLNAAGEPVEVFSIDIMTAYTPAVEARLGGLAGVIAYSNNRVWETGKIWENAGIDTFIPRLVAVVAVDDRERNPTTGALIQNGTASDPFPHTDSDTWPGALSGLKSSYVFAREGRMGLVGYGPEFNNTYVSVADFRTFVGADVVAMLHRHLAGCGCLGLSPVPDINPNTEDIGYFGVIVGPNATDQWSFSHEIGHSLGISHSDQAQDQTGFLRYWTDYTNPVIASLPGLGFRDLMWQGDGDGCRIPVLSSETWWWHADLSGSANPCDGVWADAFTNSVSPEFGNEMAFLETNGHDPATFAAVPDLPKARGREYLLETKVPANPDLTPLYIMASYRDEQASFLPYAEPELVWVDGATNTPDHFLTGPTMLGWTLSPPDELPGTNPFQLQVRLIHPALPGADDPASLVVDEFVSSATWNTASQQYEVPLGVTLPTNQTVHVRVWFQLLTNLWRSKDYVLNGGDKPVSCASQDPAFAPAAYSAASCPIAASVANYGMGRNNNILFFNQAPAPGAQNTQLFATDWRSEAPNSPFSVTAYGTMANGVDFCCQYKPVDFAVDTFGSRGTPYRDEVYLHDPTDFADLTLPYAELHMEGGEDLFVGGEVSAATVYAAGGGDDMIGGGADEIFYGEAGIDYIDGGPGFDRSYGGSSSDIMISADEEYDEMYGQTANDFLCTNFAGDMLIANDNQTNTADKLWINTTTGDPCDGGSRGRSTGAHCGDVANQWSGAWICAGTNEPWAGRTPAMGAPVGCAYTLANIPAPCAGHL